MNSRRKPTYSGNARRIYPEDRTQDANHWRRPQSHHVGRGRGVRLPEIEGVLDLLSKIFKNYIADESEMMAITKLVTVKIS